MLRSGLFFGRMQQLIEYSASSLVEIFIKANAITEDTVFFRHLDTLTKR